MAGLVVIIVFVGIAMLVFWLYQIVSLMDMPDDAFPGRHDKIIWVALLVLLPVLGAIAFAMWKPVVRDDREMDAAVSNVADSLKKPHAATDPT